MSKPKAYYIPDKHRDAATMAIIEAHFDHETDLEIAAMERESKKAAQRTRQENYARKLCILRTLSFPVDFVVGSSMFGIQFLKRRLKLQADMILFIFKKISYEEIISSIESNA
jgi:hypothetical protein